MSATDFITRLLIVDDHPLVREGLRARLDSEAHLNVVGDAASAEQALTMVTSHNPDLMLVDIGLIGMSGIELTKLLRAQHPRVAVLILSMHDDCNYVAESIKAGARGYVLKNSSTAQIVTAIDAVAAGGTYFSNGVLEAATRPDEKTVLSRREQEVLNHVVDGLSSKEIARKLNLSVRTVEAHRQTIKRKLGIDSAAELIKWALKRSMTKL